MQDYSFIASLISDCFSEAYLFGSGLRVDSPNDIDLLLVYEPSQLNRVESEKRRLMERFLERSPDLYIHTTTLSEREKDATKFLELIQHIKLK